MISFLIFLLIFGLIWYIISIVPVIPEWVKNVAYAVLVVFFLINVIGLLTGAPYVFWRF